MAVEIGTASGHYDLLAKLRTFLETALPLDERWEVQRADSSGDDHEIIWKAPGPTAGGEIYAGIKTYQSIASDYYNWKINSFTGYVPANTFETQPGGVTGDLGVPLWNQSIPYWFVGNGSRIIVVAKIENVYESLYLGKFLPYATPSQYPYPVIAGGMLTSAAATRYSEGTHVAWFKGNRDNFRMRFVDGAWRTPSFVHRLDYGNTTTFGHPRTFTYRNTASSAEEAAGHYALLPITLIQIGYPSASDKLIYGELDGVYFISGFNNAVENMLTIGADTYLVARDVWRTGFKDYIAVRLN